MKKQKSSTDVIVVFKAETKHLKKDLLALEKIMKRIEKRKIQITFNDLTEKK